MAGPGCVSGTAKGVTDKEVRVVIALTEIIGPAANSLFDVPTPAEAKADFEAAVNGINREGGVGCRKLVPTYVNVNPTDEAGMLARCREFAAGNYFAVVDTGSMATRPAVLACLGQNKVPYFGAFYITESLRRQFYPYLFSFYYKEQVYKDTAFALRDLGFFDPAKGFKKLGFAYRDCEKDAIAAFRNDLRAAGVANSAIEPYNLGCPAVFASEADMAQMTQTFIRRGVTHVIGANVQGDISRITAHFEQQGFRPKWGMPDEAMLSIATGSRAPDRNNFANAYAVTLARDGEDNTPGMTTDCWHGEVQRLPQGRRPEAGVGGPGQRRQLLRPTLDVRRGLHQRTTGRARSCAPGRPAADEVDRLLVPPGTERLHRRPGHDRRPVLACGAVQPRLQLLEDHPTGFPPRLLASLDGGGHA